MFEIKEKYQFFKNFKPCFCDLANLQNFMGD